MVMVKPKIIFEDLSKEQLIKLAREVSMGMFDLLKMIEFKEESMMDCWLVHPIDDEDCESCSIINGCRGVREHVNKIEKEALTLLKSQADSPWIRVEDKLPKERKKCKECGRSGKSTIYGNKVSHFIDGNLTDPTDNTCLRCKDTGDEPEKGVNKCIHVRMVIIYVVKIKNLNLNGNG